MKLAILPVVALLAVRCGGTAATPKIDSGRAGAGAIAAAGRGGAGASGSGGTGGAGADAATGRLEAGTASCRPHDDASADGPGSATGQFSVVYDRGALSSCLTVCSSCTDSYSPPYGNVVLAMENSAGPPETTTLYLTLGPGFQGADYSASLELIEGNLSFAKMYQGVFSLVNGSVNIGPGSCITLSSVDLAAGGGVSGTFDCDLVGQGVDNDQTTAHVAGTFSGLFL